MDWFQDGSPTVFDTRHVDNSLTISGTPIYVYELEGMFNLTTTGDLDILFDENGGTFNEIKAGSWFTITKVD